MPSIIVLIFPSRSVLVEAIDTVNRLDYLSIGHSAIIAKADDGETTVYEDDISVVEGSLTGGTMGSLISALGVAQLGAFLLPGVGPIIAIGAGALIGALVGGGAGGLAAGLIDFGFDNRQLDALAAGLQNGRCAMVIEVEDRGAVMARLQTDLSTHQVEILLPPDDI
jgi:uncharacterized membrane protein